MAYKTGRQRTISMTGTIYAEFSEELEVVMAPDPSHTHGGNSSGTMTSCWDAWVSFQRAPADPNTDGIFYGVQVNAFDGLSGTDTDLDGIRKKKDPPPVTVNWSLAASGSYSMTADVEEWCETYALSGNDSDGFPTYGGSPQPDGLPGIGIKFYEKLRPGGSVTAEISLAGATASTSTVIDEPAGGIVANHQQLIAVDLASYQAGFGYTATCSATTNGVTFPDESWSVGGGSDPSDKAATCVVSGNSVEITTTGGSFGDGATASATAHAIPLINYSYEAQMRTIGGSYPDTALIDIKQTALTTAEVEAGPTAGSSWTQAEYNVSATLLSTSFSESLNEVAGVRSWLTNAGLAAIGEDVRDWRLQFQLYPWAASTVSQDSSVTVTGSGTATVGAPDISTTETNWEGYRYLTFTATPTGFTNRDLTLTVAGKDYTFHIGTGATPVTIDLRDAINLPTGFTVDARQSRYPVNNTGPAYGPDSGPPIDTGSSTSRGWLWGMLGRPSVATVSGLTGGESLAVTAMTLTKVASNELRVLLPFMNSVLGWTSPTDSTFLDLDLSLYSDHKPVADWPCRPFVSGGTPPYVYYILSQMADFINYTPGWNATAMAENTDGPFDDSDTPTVYMLDENTLAGNIDGYIYNGTDWLDQTSRALPADLWACLKIDEVQAYSGCGDPLQDYGPTNLDFLLRTSKILRGQTEGVVYDFDAQPFTGIQVSALAPSGILAGIATATSDGWYRTGAPYGFGNTVNFTTIIPDGTVGYLATWANRYSERVSFSLVDVTCNTTPPRLPVDCISDLNALPFGSQDQCTNTGTIAGSCACGQDQVRMLPSAG